MSAIRFGLVVASATGLLLSILWHSAALLGRPFLGGRTFGIFVGIFVVWLPAVLQLKSFQAAVRSTGGWRLVLTGAPTWMKLLAGLTLPYAFVNFFLASGKVIGSVGSADPAFGRVGSGHAIAFYAAALVILYAAHRREELGIVWRCANGHSVDPPVPACPRCGARVEAIPTASELGA